MKGGGDKKDVKQGVMDNALTGQHGRSWHCCGALFGRLDYAKKLSNVHKPAFGIPVHAMHGNTAGS